MGFDYSDGAGVEHYIVELLRGETDLGSREIIAPEEQRRSWPVRYHLAVERANLLRHLDFTGLDVIELGAGMGGVSRFLAESARSLRVVEASPTRFEALSERLRDLDNWTGRVERIEDVTADGRFDVVCLIGVLEYAQRYFQPPPGARGDAFDALLAHAAGLLRPGGVLLVAIENRFGIKYWSGAGEDHSGRLFDGIVGYPRCPAARTFARGELKVRLEGCGLRAIREYFPFPDYKLPASVMSGALVERDPQLAVDLACFREFEDHLQQRSYLFPDYLALAGLAGAGLFPEFSNSFLMAAAADDGSEILAGLTRKPSPEDRRQLAWHYSPARRLPTLTIFSSDPGVASITVEKRLFRQPTSTGEAVSFGDGGFRVVWRPPAATRVARGERLRHRLLRCLYFGAGEDFEEELGHFIAWALERCETGSEDRLRGEALDAVFSNASLPGDAEEYEIFDQEWVSEAPLAASWFVLRNVLACHRDRAVFSRRVGFGTLGELYERLCRRLEVTPDLEGDVDREARFLALVGRRSSEELAGEIRYTLELPFQHRLLPPRSCGQLESWPQRIEKLAAEVTSLRGLKQVASGLEESVVSYRRALESERRSSREKLGALKAELAADERALAESRSREAELQRRLEAQEAARVALEDERDRLMELMRRRRHRLIERSYGWLRERRFLYSVARRLWGMVLWATGRRQKPEAAIGGESGHRH